MALNQHNKNIINSVSRSDVEKILSGLKRFTNKNRWLSKNNRYAVNTKDQIKIELNTGGIQKPHHLSQYIAASGILHCTDGWSYLGRAVLSLLRGDPHRARHLAYYAELRAAMSLLASVGIGVFDRQHLVIRAPHSVLPLGGRIGTHDVAWDCLTSWAELGPSGDLFARIVKPDGRSLDEWLVPIGGARVVAAQAQDWFRQWGMDLQIFSGDRDARNVSSYRPDGIPENWSIDASVVFQFVREMWGTLEPSSTPFENVDRSILRLSLESIFRSRTGRLATDDSQAFYNFVKPIVEHQNVSAPGTNKWLNFITRKLAEKDPNIFYFSTLPPVSFDHSVLAIMSRAVLLLRIASGSNSLLLQDCGYDAESMAFWWQRMAQDLGLSDSISDVEALTDLWTDIAEHLADIEDFQNNYPADKQTFSRFGLECGKATIGLGSCERVAIWGITPA